MGKRNTRNKTLTTTLTKIDPSILKLGPTAVSQHAAEDGTRVTTTVNPVVQFPSPADPIVFGFDPEGIDEDPVVCNGGGDGTGGYYVSRVCNIACRCVSRLTVTRTTHSYCGGVNATYSLMNLFDSKAEGCPRTAFVNFAVTGARFAVLIVLQFSSFVARV